MALDELRNDLENALFGAKEAFLLKEAEVGNAEAMVMLGLMYEATDEEKALHWYQKAANLNCADAFYCLGEFYETPAHYSVVEANDEVAEQYFLKGIALGSVDAMHELGTRYFHSGNKEKGLELINKSAELGNPISLIWLSTCYRCGWIGRKSVSKAYEYAYKAFDKLYNEKW